EPASLALKLCGEDADTDPNQVRRPDVAAEKLAEQGTEVVPLDLLGCSEELRRLATEEGLAIRLLGRVRLREPFQLASRRVVRRWRRRLVRGDSPEPSFLPVEPAARLAAAVRRTVAAQIVEEDSPAHAAGAASAD